MGSVTRIPIIGAEGRIPAAIRLIASALALASAMAAQTIPAAATTVVQPSYGNAVFDSTGNAYYLEGPVTPGAAQTQSGGTCLTVIFHGAMVPEPCPAAGVTKVDPSGNVVFGTLLGGYMADSGSALAVDAAGNVFLTGTTGGLFPTTAGAAIPMSTVATVFAARLNADGSKFVYSTYLPATAATSAAIAVDAQDNAYIAGTSGAHHAYVIKVSSDGSTILYNVALAGSGTDAATAIAIDAAGNVTVAGQTTSADFPVTKGAFQPKLAGVRNNFLTRLDPAGNMLMSTYLGGSGSDSPAAVALDGAGNIDLAGQTTSLDFPTTAGTFQPAANVPAWNNSSPGGFVAQVSPNGSSLNWGSYVMSNDIGLGRPNVQVGVSQMAVTPAGDIYLGGISGVGFPTTPSAPQVCLLAPASTNGFVAHLSAQGSLLDATYLNTVIGTDRVPSGGSEVSEVFGLKPMAGNSVLVAWHSSGSDAVSNLQFGSGGWAAPACLSTSPLNAATQDAGAGIAPGELVTLTGYGIGPEIGAVYQPNAQGQIPTELAGVQVSINNEAVPVLYAQSRQINVVAPTDLTVGSSTGVEVRYQGQQFGPFLTAVTYATPGIFRLQVSQTTAAVAMNQDTTLNSPSNPAPRGSIVTVWTTGYGNTAPACVSGGLNDPQAEPLSLNVNAMIYDGTEVYPVTYAGSSPGLACGIVQVNFQIPTTAAPGNYWILPWVEFGTGIGNETAVGSTIAIK
jgi:uncharacterized protein (TIGR03437 family)